MDAILYRVSQQDVVGLLWDSAVVRALLSHADRAPDWRLNLGDAWAALHFLLTAEYPIPRQELERIGSRWSNDPLEEALMGGIPTTFPGSYGPARYLDAGLVRTVSASLSGISTDGFLRRFDAEELEKAQIPPGGWEDTPGTQQWLTASLQALKRFYATATANADGVLVVLV